MRNRLKRLLMLCPIFVLAIVSFTRAQAPATAPAGNRGPAEIMTDIQTEGAELRNVLSSPDILMDEAQRKAAAPKATAVLEKMMALANEMAGLDDPRAKASGEQLRNQFTFLLAAFEDPKTVARLKEEAAGADAAATVRAKSMLLTSNWLHAAKDPAAQGKLVDEAAALAKANPGNKEVTEVLQQLAHMPPASPEIARRVEAVVDEYMANSPPRTLENKPLVVSGTLHDGRQFSTADWKGKVVMVDFWATWCGPCIAELPRVKKAYTDYHDKGFEIVSISCDNEAEALNAYLKKNPDMPWPQLFDAQDPGWHALAKEYGVDSIPRMFLIDKKGVVRTVDARENFEEMIPKLLGE